MKVLVHTCDGAVFVSLVAPTNHSMPISDANFDFGKVEFFVAF